jgi:acyl-CoA thioesterase
LTLPAAGASAFDRATAVTAAGDGRWSARCDAGWSAPNGPNGGYLAAIVLRAMEAQLADPARDVRSLTCHYLRPPHDGDVAIAVTVERSGRSVSALSARLEQDDRLCVLAVAAFAVERDGTPAYGDAPPPAPPPESVATFPVRPEAPPMVAHFELRPVFGGLPFSGAAEALTGGWLRFAQPRALDAAALALYADAWLPAPFPRLEAPSAAPTLDLTVHFRAPRATAAVAPDEPVLARFRSSTAAGGFFEEDGELWSRDGVLLAQSRQLALLA